MSMTKMTTCLPCMQENPDCVTEINTVGWIEILDEHRIFPSSAPLPEQLLPAEDKETGVRNQVKLVDHSQHLALGNGTVGRGSPSIG